jgi:hypothetical protein
MLKKLTKNLSTVFDSAFHCGTSHCEAGLYCRTTVRSDAPLKTGKPFRTPSFAAAALRDGS